MLSEVLFKSFVDYLRNSNESNDSLELLDQAHSLFDLILEDVIHEKPSHVLIHDYLMIYEDICRLSYAINQTDTLFKLNEKLKDEFIQQDFKHRAQEIFLLYLD